jgi:hypothetical protein
MLDELGRAIEEAEWSSALVLALDAWRTSRAPVLANLVDRIAARLPAESVPPERVQRWWMQQARTYDPLRATTLLANAAELALKSGVDDEAGRPVPQARDVARRSAVARVLATWFADTKARVPSFARGEVRRLLPTLADHLLRLCDTRAIPPSSELAEPRGFTISARETQRALATYVIDALADAAPTHHRFANAGEIARWCPSPATPMVLDERTLWREAAEDEEARLVLADYLLERRSARRDHTLANAGTDDTASKASALLHEHWERWMGDLALVLDRGNCSFVGGLLDVATIGTTAAGVGVSEGRAASRAVDGARGAAGLERVGERLRRVPRRARAPTTAHPAYREDDRVIRPRAPALARTPPRARHERARSRSRAAARRKRDARRRSDRHPATE